MSLDYLLKGHKAQVFAVRFTPEGILYSGSEDGTIRLWDLRTHKASQCVVCESAVIDVDFMDNLLYCASGNSIYTYDLRMIPSNTKLIRTFVNKQTFDIDEISAFKCHHKASYYAVADDNGGLYIYYTKTEQLKNIRNRKGHTNDVSSIAFRPHSLYDMITAGYDYRCLLWQTSSTFPKCEHNFAETGGQLMLSPPFVFKAEYVCNGRLLACALGSGNISFLNSATLEDVSCVENAHNDLCTVLSAGNISADGTSETLISSGADRMLRRWKIEYALPEKKGGRKDKPSSSVMVRQCIGQEVVMHANKVNAVAILSDAVTSSCSGVVVADTSSIISVYSYPPS